VTIYESETTPDDTAGWTTDVKEVITPDAIVVGPGTKFVV